MPYVYIDRYLAHNARPTAMPWLKIAAGISGSMSVVCHGFNLIPNNNDIQIYLGCTAIQILCLPFLYLIMKGVIEINDAHNMPTVLYERALKVKQMLFDIQDI